MAEDYKLTLIPGMLAELTFQPMPKKDNSFKA